MKQVLLGASLCFAASATDGGLSSYGNSAHAKSVIPTGGTLSSLRVRLASAPGAGDPVKSYTIALLVNGSPTLSVVVATAATTGLDAGSQAVSAGDLVQIKITPANTPANNFLCDYSLIFEGSTAGESIILGASGATLLNTGTEYAPLSGMLVAGPNGTESVIKQIIPTAGTIKNLYWALSADPGTSPDAYTLTLRKSGSSTSLTSTITADNTTGSDVDAGHAVTVAAGDDVGLMIEPVSSPSAVPGAYWGCVFVADVNGESLIMGCYSGTAANSAERFNYCTGVENVWAASTMYMVANAFTAKKLYVELSGSPYANSTSADKYTVSVRIATTNSAVAAEVVDGGTGNTVGNSGANSVDVADGDLISMSSVPASSPTARAISWGFVCYIAPQAATYDESLTLGIAGEMTRAGILSAINSATFSMAAAIVRSNLAAITEAIAFALSAAQDQSGGMTFEEAVTLAMRATEARSASVEMNAGLSLGISAEQGTGSVAELNDSLSLAISAEQTLGSAAELNAFIALSLAAAIIQACQSTSTYNEAVTLTIAAGFSRTAFMEMVEAVALAVGLECVFIPTTPTPGKSTICFIFRKRRDHFRI